MQGFRISEILGFSVITGIRMIRIEVDGLWFRACSSEGFLLIGLLTKPIQATLTELSSAHDT